LDIRYATANNFSKTAVYNQARAFARAPVVQALADIQNALKKKGLGLLIFDAYRPYAVTVKFFQLASNKDFVANPKNGSRHNRGCAIDLTLINLKTGKPVLMPTDYDSFAPEASIKAENISKKAKKDRDLLIRVMTSHGFSALENEWWHYDFKGWDKYSLMDIPFEKL